MRVLWTPGGKIVGRVILAAIALVGCMGGAPMTVPSVGVTLVDQTAAQPRLASDPAQLAKDLVADEATIRESSTSVAALAAAARRQQAAYRAIGFHSDWDAVGAAPDPGVTAGDIRPQR